MERVTSPALLTRLQKRLKRYRLKREWTQQQMADYLGKSIGTYLTYESGRRMKKMDRLKYNWLIEKTAGVD